MGLITAIAAIGVAASIAGTVVGMKGAQAQAKAQKQQAQAQMRAEEERKKAMNLDAYRKQRAQIREGQKARAEALATANSQGADSGTGLAGAYGGIEGQVGTNMQGVEQQRQIGNRMFDHNMAYYAAGGRAAKAGAQIQLGGGISALGGALVNNAGTIGRIGTYMAGR
jgi:hypothetical protein